MRSWVEKLRRVLLVGGVLLLLVLAAVLGYSRYQALRTWHRILQRSGATLTRETNGFTYSQSVGGRTVFTLHAAKAVQAKDGKYALHDVSLLLYRQADGRADRVYGSEFEYDQKTGVARALGPVHMDLQAPRSFSLTKPGPSSGQGTEPTAKDKTGTEVPAGNGAEADLENGPEIIHVKTSGLVYVRNLGVAATDQDVEFRYGKLECHARGAEFNSGQSTVHLLADVHVNGDMRGRELNLTAARADLDRQTNVALLKNPEVRTDGKIASAVNAVLHLRPDGSLETGDATGTVRLVRGTQVVTADRAEARSGVGSVMQDLRLIGNVGLSDANQQRPLKAHAGTVHASFDSRGSTREVLAEGSPSLEFFDRGQLKREVRGDRMEARFVSTGAKLKPLLQVVRISGKAHASAESFVHGDTPKLAIAGGESSPSASFKVVSATGGRRGRNPGLQTGASSAPSDGETKGLTSIEAGELVLTMDKDADGRPEPRFVEGTGNTVLEQTLPRGISRRSTGDRLTLKLGRAEPRQVEVGQPEVRTGAKIKGAPSGISSGVSSGAASFEVVSASQQGNVTLRSVAAASAKIPATVTRQSVIIGTAQRAEFTGGSHQVLLTGQARLRSDDGELSAAAIELDTVSNVLDARGQVLATLTEAEQTGRATMNASRRIPLHVTATNAHFVNDSGLAEFHGTDAEPVRLWQGGSKIEAAAVTLDRRRNAVMARPSSAAGLVRCVFSEERSAGATKTGGASPAGGGILRVTSARLDYDGGSHEANFSGGVRSGGPLGEVHSQTAVVFLQSDPAKDKKGKAPAANGSAPVRADSSELLGGAVEKVVLSGKVQLEQPGRVGTGEQLLYTAANSSFVLTGTAARPPHIVDVQQGSLTGTTLLFRTGDNTVVVASDPAHAGASRSRVRTELNLRH